MMQICWIYIRRIPKEVAEHLALAQVGLDIRRNMLEEMVQVTQISLPSPSLGLCTKVRNVVRIILFIRYANSYFS